jgi:GTPase
MHKAGFVNIVGNPNAGKSTLMNALVGERISIITSKAQTTRHRIMGIVNGEDFQVVYSDTPGIIKPKYKMQEGMMSFVGAALEDADVLLLVIDLADPEEIEEKMYNRIQKTEAKVLVLLNKMDIVKTNTALEQVLFWKKELPNSTVLPVSALTGQNTELVFKTILELLPEHPAYFAKDELTDKPERFFIAEIVREKILLNYDKEIPYSCEVVVEEFKESPDIIRMRAIIFVSRETQKGIILGHQGKAIKQLGIDSRKDIEAFLQKKVFIELFVKVDKEWRSSERELKRFGYL